MQRVVAKLTGGPLDGVLVSTGADQEEIGGLDFAGYEPMKMTDDNVPSYVDKYVKDKATQRDFEGHEAALAESSFPGLSHIGICEFTYVAG